MLKNYKPKGLVAPAKNLSDSALAISVINGIKSKLPEELRKFAGDVVEDIQNYGTIPTQTVRKIKEIGNAKQKEGKRVEDLAALLGKLLEIRGADYLAKQKMRYEKDAVIVTVEKR